KRVVGIGLVLHFAEPLGRLHRRRRVGVIQQRGRSGEPFVSHQLLGVNTAVRFPKRDVPLSGYLTHRMIDRHVRSLSSFGSHHRGTEDTENLWPAMLRDGAEPCSERERK